MTIKVLDIKYLDKILDLQELIIDYLGNKELFVKTDRDSIIEIISGDGIIVGCTDEKDNLIAFGALFIPKLKEENLGYDLNLSYDELIKLGHIEATVVHPNYRGNKLQKIICSNLECLAKDCGCEILCATVSPINIFSLNTFTSLSYSIVTEKIKYGGYNRYILRKDI